MVFFSSIQPWLLRGLADLGSGVRMVCLFVASMAAPSLIRRKSVRAYSLHIFIESRARNVCLSSYHLFLLVVSYQLTWFRGG
jgi:hypothetical protein